MAEGGDFGYDDPDLDRKFDNYDDEDENEVTRDGYDSERGKEYRSPDLHPPPPFPPPPRRQNQAFFLARCDVYMDFGKLHPIGFSKKGNHSDVVQFGSKGGETKFSKVTAQGFLKISQKDFQALWDQALKKYYSRRPWYNPITAPKIGGC